MPTRKPSHLREISFSLINILLLNAVFFTALILWGHKDVNYRFLAILFNVSSILAISLEMPIAIERTMYQDKVLAIAFKGITTGFVLFLALLWLADIFEFGIGFIILLYISLTFCSLIIASLFRWSLKNIRKKGVDSTNVLILGNGTTAGIVANVLEKNRQYGYNIMGYAADKQSEENMNIPYLGTHDNINTIISTNNIKEIYLADDKTHKENIGKLIDLCNNNFIELFLVPELGKFSQRKFDIVDNSMGLTTLSFHPESLSYSHNRILKRSFDLFFSIFVLSLLLIPVIIPVSLAIKFTSKGPVLFKQKRTGYHGKEFICYKFRSMVMNPECDTTPTAKNDARITKVGKIIRKTSIDELPQFLNVLKGDMSVVGPRPHIVMQTEENRKLLDNYMIRHKIKPGITGWAQINNLRGTVENIREMEERVKADIWYIDNWSIILDIKIVARTIYNIIFTKENKAY